ncbi:phosphatidylglycerophosphatase A [uncultured Castellaniella sp.]|jgi:phosphatidylglycerophosphatase A|uniref:phosphatidylglycerophosphatase A family protein n=1 Tax=uncultured Castellaniella sp. TaxID=647907 RepID=UPI002618E75D|nr:phosphatidylglycerophosphatase A [uncultured Castellaniella sp.]
MSSSPPPDRGRAPDNPERPPAAWVFARPERILAFGFGSGLIHPAPGTWGTLTGWLLWAVLLRGLPDGWMVFILLLAFGVGCWAAQRCSDDLGIADHGGINWDEIVAIWLVLWLMPAGFWAQLAGVVLFRIFDILKPPPVSVLDRRFKNGFGVMIDDIFAAVYALLAAAVLIRLGVL